MNIALYGSSLLSSYWNGAATYYRGILRALAGHGHAITFYEPDAFGRAHHRDIAPPDWCGVVVYPATMNGVRDALSQAGSADVVIKASGVGYADAALLDGLTRAAAPHALKVFWDVDAPATLAEIATDPDHALRRALPDLDLVLTYGGGDPVITSYRALGAARCVPIYNALDPEAHFPVPSQQRFASDLTFLGNRLPDREARVRQFFLEPASRRPEARFLLGGSGWADMPVADNVGLLGHVPTAQHNALNCSARMVLNISRESMAATGFSPATRLFEVAGAGACLITDDWTGLALFLTPGQEVIAVRDGADVIDALGQVTAAEARRIGEAGRRRVLSEHTYDRRAILLDQVLCETAVQSRVLGRSAGVR